MRNNASEAVEKLLRFAGKTAQVLRDELCRGGGRRYPNDLIRVLGKIAVDGTIVEGSDH